ncbi:PTS system mannose/fructose/N-acetylgalactosamine-transporter subunit IIB [Enterococcus sp. AZ109]|uniref:PTS system mannose/fructose/N-acetylgalactosamine-transporter subunit IIB n=1 Tax=Enterococcus sp. AZ109 TaxID=2774634 RepID=UPI003F6829E7
MGSINLIRADFRLIHGQVITKWLKEANAKKIVVINDELAKDTFLASIYTMAAPPGTKVEIHSIKDAVPQWEKDQFGKEPLLVLFKSIDDVYEAKKAGFPMEELQIGGLGGGPGRVNVLNQISLDQHDVDLLKEIQEQGTHVYLHVLPTEPKIEFDKVLTKFN